MRTIKKPDLVNSLIKNLLTKMGDGGRKLNN